jgi:O-antigen/teichoic acid export membrane protein
MKAVMWVVGRSPRFIQKKWEQIQRSPVGQRLARGLFWNFVSIVLSRVLTLAVSVLVARLLGKESFGKLGIVMGTVALFQTFASVGVGLTTTKYVSEHRAKEPTKAGHIIALSNLTAGTTGLLMAVALAVLAPWLAVRVLAEPKLDWPLMIACPALLLGAFNGVQTGVLIGLEAFKTNAKLGVSTALAGAPIMALGVWYGGIEGGAWALVGQAIITTVFNQISVRSEMRRAKIWPQYKGCMEQWRVLVHYSLPAFLGGLLVGPVNWACNAVIVNRPQGYSEMGVFNAANQWFTAIMFIPGVLAPVLLPILSERAGAKDQAGSRKILSHAMAGLAIVALPAALIMCVGAKWIMAMYGLGFASSWPTFVVVVLTAALVAVMMPVGDIIAASAKMWVGFAMNLGWATCFIAATVLLSRWGALGLAGARGIAYLAHGIWTFAYARKILREPSREIWSDDVVGETPVPGQEAATTKPGIFPSGTP